MLAQEGDLCGTVHTYRIVMQVSSVLAVLLSAPCIVSTVMCALCIVLTIVSASGGWDLELEQLPLLAALSLNA
jgi:hypothetical protein